MTAEDRIQKEILDFTNRRHKTSDKLRSGIPSFDLSTGGGIARGRITEVYDLEAATGKTSLALQYSRTTTNDGGLVLYFSIEQRLSKRVWEHHGVDTSRLAICSLGSDEEIIEVVRELSPDLVVIDSLAAVVPTGETMESQYRYNLLRKVFREIYEAISRSGAAALFLNQSRMALSKSTTVGGVSIERWADLRIQLRSGGLIHRRFIPVGRTILMDLVYRDNPTSVISLKTDMMFDTGFDIELDLLDLALKHSVVVREGARYRYTDLELGIGRESASLFLKNNTQVYEQVWQSILEVGSNVQGDT